MQILLFCWHVLTGAATMGATVPLAVNRCGTAGYVAMEPVLRYTELAAVRTCHGNA